MKSWASIISSLIISGTILYLAMHFFQRKECDPEVIRIEVPVPKPYPVPSPAPDPVHIDTNAIEQSILATIDTAYIQSLVSIDTVAIIDSILATIDTTQILKDYYSIYTYRQTITDDTTMAVDLMQKITQNRIIDQSAQFTQLKKDIHYIELPRATNQIYVGGVVTAGQSLGIAPSVSYTNDRMMYGIGYDTFNKLLLLEGKWKIKSW